ncbi:ubiquinol-cytochrome c reductase complex 6.7 kDa protein [Humulus lupulus]|uniref:ubiquinol-cytochrome c reductase complex 6.7 kDa protein n=1 Tax=Humulus lupulus TaxID=3486 RepID=UPI002B40E302|nr:ubiquinol-cytochrome c reductase complex 6.7 kDa protein [Humulus lupulus]
MAGEAGLLKSLRPRIRIQSDDIKSAALWGVAATTTALWVVQPFNWLKKTFLEKPEPEK